MSISNHNVLTNSRRIKEFFDWTEDNYWKVLENLLSGIVVLDSWERVMYLNKASEEIIGYTLTEIEGMSIRKYIHPLDIEMVLGNYQKRICGGEPSNQYRARIITKDGKTVWVDIKVNVIDFEGERLVIANLADITEKVETEKLIQVQYEQLFAIFNGMDIGVYVIDIETHEILYMNDRLRHLFGEPKNNCRCFEHFTQWNHPCPCCNSGFLGNDVGLKGAANREFQSRLSEYWFHSIDKIIPWPDGRMVRMEILIDVTERKIAEEQSKYQAYLLSRVRESIIAIDNEGKITFWNQGAKDLFGWDEEEMLGRTIWPLFVNGHIYQKHLLEMEVIPHEAGYWRRSLTAMNRNEQKMILDVSVYPTEKDNHEKNGALVVCHDITGLVEAKKSAEVANRAKSDFLANMSHEIRTPLGGILGFADLLLREELLPRQRESVEFVFQCGEQLLNLVNDILDLSKIESGKMALELTRFNLRELINKALAVVSPAIQQKGLEINMMINPETPSYFEGDDLKIRQVLINLLSNAAKFTHEGEIRVRVGPGDQQNESSLYPLQVSVRDSGIGMTSEEMAIIFDSFCQGDASTSRRYGGTGLGLTISKSLVELMGGKIWIESEAGTGTMVSFSLPLCPVKELEYDGTRQEIIDYHKDFKNIGPKSILVVDDVEINQKLMVYMLESLGYQVTVAGNGYECLALLKKQEFDLVLMDIQMPYMDGYETTINIRQNQKWADLPIIALTAHAMKGDAEKCLIAGCDDYISKPVTISILERTLQKHLGYFRNPENYDPGVNEIVEGLRLEFLEYLEEMVDSLEVFIKQNDYEKVYNIAHDIKGTAGLYGFAKISSMAAGIENQIKSHDVKPVETMCKNLKDGVKSLRIPYQCQEIYSINWQ